MDADTNKQSPWTTRRLLEWTADYLSKSQVDQPRLCAEILLAHILKCKRIDLYVKFDHCPDAEQLAAYKEQVRRCGKHEPVAYLTGKAHFYSLELMVEPGVLIPRPETEVLVTESLDFIRDQADRPTVDVLDLCTGSGCIAIAIAANAVEAEIIAAENSRAALQIAQKNIKANELEGRVTLVESDLFAGMGKADKSVFDLIVSNPPYISMQEYEKLEPVVRDYEPKEALLAGNDGLDYYRRIVAEAEPYLADDGLLMVEVAYNQADDVTRLFEESGYLDDVATVKDHLGHKRIIKARKK
ncbi:MAG: peptide chain release factor N(5)-glutamine methyltransferase [Sedimentisphaerales bacterium]|nr:peptide chain release factor N(5)-glutamine methyltransferase [Sedimentisphaerales bacterium]